MWGSRGVAPRILLCALDGGERSASLFKGKEPSVRNEKRLEEAQSRSGHCREENGLLFVPGVEFQFLGRPAHSLVQRKTKWLNVIVREELEVSVLSSCQVADCRQGHLHSPLLL